MEPNVIFHLLARLERDIAGFYSQMGTSRHLKALQPLFDFMERHSLEHAERIDGQTRCMEIDPPRIEPIQELHHRLKRSLGQQLATETDPVAVADKLAQAEAIVGQVYQGLSAHYNRVAREYGRLADTFAALAVEEDGHSEYALREKARLLEPPPPSATAGSTTTAPQGGS
jgi:hypothetical protein